MIAVVYERSSSSTDVGEPQPMLAESWDTPDDHHLRLHAAARCDLPQRQATDAEDVKFTFDRIKDEATASPRVAQFTSVDEIEATDDRTVTFRLSAPYGPSSRRWQPAIPRSCRPTTRSTCRPRWLYRAVHAGVVEADTETVLAANTGYWTRRSRCCARCGIASCRRIGPLAASAPARSTPHGDRRPATVESAQQSVACRCWSRTPPTTTCWGSTVPRRRSTIQGRAGTGAWRSTARRSFDAVFFGQGR